MIDERLQSLGMQQKQNAQKKLKVRKDAVIYSYHADEIGNNYEFLKKIGQGTYGVVMKARNKKSDELVAIKMVQKKSMNFASEEVELLKTLDHPNIVKLHELYENDSFLFLVLELCESNVLDFFQKQNGGSDVDLATICTKILSALAYCHKRGIIHRDIKFQNVLLGNANDIRTVKLIDFGLSVNIEETKQLTQALGTATYLAPEVISGSYNEKADIWSLGVLLYYLVLGKPPFVGNDAQELYMNILSHCRNSQSIPRHWVEQNPIGDLINKMLVYSPEERYSAEELLRHTWLRGEKPMRENCITGEVIKNISKYMIKNKFLRMLSFQYATKWKDTYCDALKDSFTIIDTDQDGVISEDEFIEAPDSFSYQYQAMKTFSGYIGENLFHPEILKMVFFSLDSNNNGQIDYTEFQALFSQNDLFKNEKLLMEQFKLVDVVRLPKSILLFNRLTFKREDGVLDKSEIKEFFQTTCGDISESSLFSIIQDIDLNGDGKIDFNELQQAVTKQQP